MLGQRPAHAPDGPRPPPPPDTPIFASHTSVHAAQQIVSCACDLATFVCGIIVISLPVERYEDM